MANSKEHSNIGEILGLALGIGSYIIKQNNNPDSEFNLLEFAGYAAGGYGLGSIVAKLPDIIEPASDPNHRKTFHSWGAGIAITWGTIKAVTDTDLSHEAKTAIAVAGAGYLSHLALDADTPKGLPMI